ncbi:MAG: hypothetical protein LBO66_06270 [Deltaproteobacteria bacterium]|nr:hypothetical protein [Deltaproteobacteria bacterium]
MRGIIEIKFSAEKFAGKTAKTKLLNNLAKKALLAIDGKRYSWSSRRDDATLLVNVGVGVTFRGECLVRIGD